MSVDRRQFLKSMLGVIGAAVIAPILPLAPSQEVAAAIVHINPKNKLLTSSQITKEALMILHEKLLFMKPKIRRPNRYVVRQGA